jgi:hypothetical protein
MTTSESDPQETERFPAPRLPFGSYQSAIEQEASRLRVQVGASDFEYLALERAVTCLPNCAVLSLRHVPGMTLQMLSYARTQGYDRFGAFARRDGDVIQIVYNDAHHPCTIRANVMEELFHVRLGHKPDIMTLVPTNGRFRTHDANREREAYGCAIAALVPYAGLRAMLASQMHLLRVAEHFAVTVDVVQERIAATNLGELMNMQLRGFAVSALLAR